jgi:hypothetical protein
MYSTKLTFPQSVDIRGEKLTYTTLGGKCFLKRHQQTAAARALPSPTPPVTSSMTTQPTRGCLWQSALALFVVVILDVFYSSPRAFASRTRARTHTPIRIAAF